MSLLERAYTFGSDNGLCGIASEPCGDSDIKEKTAVILLNAGLLHHVGQNRLSVNLARFLAQRAYFTFRFDLSGIGDSVTRRDGDSIQERSVTEIREAMDYLQNSKGLQRFILFGLCTGADNAFRTATADPRVSGVILLEGYSYPTKAYSLRRYGPKLFKLSTWKNIIKRIKTLSRARSPGENDNVPMGDISYHWSLPPKDRMREDLQALIERDVKMLMVFVGNNQQYKYAGQFADAFHMVDFSRNLREEYFSKCDHNFSMFSDRTRLFENINEWLENNSL